MPYIPKAKHKTLKRFNELGLSWKSIEKRILPEIRSIEPKLRAIEPKLRSIEPGRNAQLILQ